MIANGNSFPLSHEPIFHFYWCTCIRWALCHHVAFLTCCHHPPAFCFTALCWGYCYWTMKGNPILLGILLLLIVEVDRSSNPEENDCNNQTMVNCFYTSHLHWASKMHCWTTNDNRSTAPTLAHSIESSSSSSTGTSRKKGQCRREWTINCYCIITEKNNKTYMQLYGKKTDPDWSNGRANHQ